MLLPRMLGGLPHHQVFPKKQQSLRVSHRRPRDRSKSRSLRTRLAAVVCASVQVQRFVTLSATAASGGRIATAGVATAAPVAALLAATLTAATLLAAPLLAATIATIVATARRLATAGRSSSASRGRGRTSRSGAARGRTARGRTTARLVAAAIPMAATLTAAALLAAPLATTAIVATTRRGRIATASSFAATATAVATTEHAEQLKRLSLTRNTRKTRCQHSSQNTILHGEAPHRTGNRRGTETETYLSPEPPAPRCSRHLR